VALVRLHQHILIVLILPVFEHICKDTGKRRFTTAQHKQPMFAECKHSKQTNRWQTDRLVTDSHTNSSNYYAPKRHLT